MINPLGAAQFARQIETQPLHSFADLDDDEADADDDSDEDDPHASPLYDRWFTGAGFGSPEWWSHH